MGLSYDLISEFVKITNDKKENTKEGTVYATVVSGTGGKYVRIDGSDLLTPMDTTTDIEDGERVTLMIKDHKAIVTGNVTTPSASTSKVDKVTESVNSVSDRVGTFELVVADKVSTNELEAYKATIEVLIANKATIEDLTATNAKIENLEVKNAEIENLVAGKATIEDLEAVNATIENLKAKDAEIEHAVIENLEATTADIKILNADFAQIKTLVNGNLTSDNILSFNLTSEKVTVDDAFIKDAMIDTISAGKINAGKINTNSVSIGSEDGGMLITGSTQQFTDKNGNVRIQIGKDASGDFTFVLYGEDGTGQLINQNGITASAISDGLIVNDMVSDNAAISGGKLDISSVITEINGDTSTTIKSSKIYLNEQAQSLEVAFNSLKTKVDTIQEITIEGDLTAIVEQVQSNTSKIEANKDSIRTLIAEDTVIKKQVTDLQGTLSETETTLNSKYTTLSQSLDGFKTTVANTYATKKSVTDAVDNIEANYSTTSVMNSAIEQKAQEISASVSSTYATKNEVSTLDNNLKTNYSTTQQMESAINIAKEEINLGVSTLQTTVDNHTTQINSKVDLTTVNDKIDAIQVGGRNLLPRARTFENWQGVGQNGVKVVKDGFKPGMNSLKFTQGGEVIVDDELQRKALKNLANTHMIVTNPEDSAYSLYPNPPKGSTFNSVNRDGSLRKGEISSNGSCWAIISAYKYYTEVPTTSDIEQKLLQIMKDCADFMCDNLSVGRFNSMNFEFIDIGYKYSSKTRAGWTVGTYKELYLSTMFLQVKSLAYAYKIHKNQRYLDTAYKVLDSLYNVQIYIKDKVAKGDLPTEADGAFYEYLACDNLSSSNRFLGSSKILPLGMGYYISQGVDALIEIVGDNERTTAKGDSYRPSTIKTEYTKFLSSMIKTGNLTAKPTNLPYGHYYKSEDGTFKLGNWNFIDGTFGDEWFVGDVVCYTIIGLASLGFKTEAKQYMNAYYSLKVPNSSGRFTGDTVFYDRIDFSTGSHLPDDESVSITYTALYMEMGVILKEMTHVENCANTLLKWQVSEPNNIKVDGAYMWDISKDTSSLELKSYGEIVNSEFFKYLSPQKIRNRATTASVSTALTSNIAGKEFALSGWLKASNWNALASGLNACLKIGGKTYASLKLSDVIKNNNWTRFELLGSVEKEDEILTFELINNTSTTVEVAVLKLEKGNKITDFTDAPEDVEDNIVTSKNDAISSANNTLATTIANYYTKKQTDSRINIAKEAIDLSVSNTYETKESVTTKMESTLDSAKSYADTKKNEAIKSADKTLTSTIANYYTKIQTDSQINIAKEAIDLSVSNTYETKESVTTKMESTLDSAKSYADTKKNEAISTAADDATSKVNKINVGSVNRLTGTSEPYVMVINNASNYTTWDPYSTPDKQTLKQLGFKVGDQITLSFNWKISKNGSNNYVYGNFRTEFVGYNSNGDKEYKGVIKNPVATFSSSNTSGRSETTVTLTETNLAAWGLRIRIDNSVLTLTISDVKMEKGNKATSWSPAPEDVESDITSIQSETKSLKSTVSSLQLGTDSISASVKSLEESMTNTTNGLSSDISRIQDQVNLKMSTNDVKLEIQKEMSKGASKVSTSTGFTFDQNGLNISKSDSEMKTQITEDGMKIYKNSEVMLTANNQGVDAKNLHATTYLIIGNNSRMEDFTENGSKRTAVFWIG